MLLRFCCKNFRSIREEQELSLVATKTRSDERNDSLLDTPIKDVKGLRCVAIYGANASGKSNVLSAMHTFSWIVSTSQRKWNPTGAIHQRAWDPFVLDEISRTGETEFQIDFVLGSRVYNYGFRFNRAVFVEEWLKEKTGREKQLFRRMTEGSTISVKFPGRSLGATVEDSKHLDAIKLQTRPNSLFLSAAAQSNHKLHSDIFEWISIRFHEISSNVPHALRLYTADAFSEPNRKKQIKMLMRNADIGISEIEVAEEEQPEQSKKIHAAFVRALKEVDPEAATNMSEATSLSRHNIKIVHSVADGKSFPLDFEEESDGTKTYFNMLGPILDVLKDGTLVLVDELEASLHPNLARQIVRIFNDPALNPNGAQLIFATHDTNLLDLNLLRRDQIWLTEKNQNGATVLVPLSDFKVRKDQNIASAYLHGRFGAIPFLDETLLQGALESPNKKSSEPASNDEAR
jgi:hypothetical protein